MTTLRSLLEESDINPRNPASFGHDWRTRIGWPAPVTLGFRVPLQPRQTLIPVSPGTRTLTVNNQTPARPRRGHLQSESLATTRKLHCIHQNHGRIPPHEPPTQGPHLPHLQRPGRRVPGRREHQPPRAPSRAAADPRAARPSTSTSRACPATRARRKISSTPGRSPSGPPATRCTSRRTRTTARCTASTPRATWSGRSAAPTRRRTTCSASSYPTNRRSINIVPYSQDDI